MVSPESFPDLPEEGRDAEQQRKRSNSCLCPSVPLFRTPLTDIFNCEGRPGSLTIAIMTSKTKGRGAYLAEILDNDIRLTHAGDATRLPENVQEALYELEGASAHCSSMALNLALSYGAREEITRAVRSIAARVAAGELAVDDIEEATIDASLDTAGLPDPDLVIRTSGELRLSNFLLWQVAYAELYVTDLAWPDFRVPQLHEALEAFGRRQRRFGKTGEQLTVEEA